MRFTKVFNRIVLLLMLVAPGAPVHATVISGTFAEWDENPGLMTIGDGVNHVTMNWSIASFDASGWFYGRIRSGDSNVAIATEVTHITQISDASKYEFTEDFVGPGADALLDPDGVGDFVIWRNLLTGHFGVLRIDAITSELVDYRSILDGTWWFQTDGSGDFSAVPLPAGLLLLASALGAVGLRRQAAVRRARNP